MKNFVNNLLSDQRGNVAVVFSLIVVPLIIIVGLSIDSSRMRSAQVTLQSLNDAAALRAALVSEESDQRKMRSAKFDAKLYMETSLNDHEELTFQKTQVTRNGQGKFRVQTQASLKPSFVRAFGYPKYNISVVSEVDSSSLPGAEVVFVVDATNSMAFDNRWDMAMDAIEEVLNQLSSYTGEDELFVSLVPFQNRVNIGTAAARQSWFNGPPPTTASPNDWTGCVAPREENLLGFPWALTDKTPTELRFEYSTLYSPSGLVDSGHQNDCPSQSISGPTNNIEQLVNSAKSLTTSGTGRPDIGMAWGWRMLSPNWANHWGTANYPASDITQRKKFLVLLTDGRTTAYRRELSEEQDFGYNMGSIVGFEHLVKICDDAKLAGVEVYVLQIEGNPNATPYFQRCASSAEHHIFVTEPEDIEPIFEDINSRYLAMLRLTR